MPRAKKLTAAQVQQILVELDRGVYQKAVAQQFGVSQATISFIVNGYAWTTVTGRKPT